MVEVIKILCTRLPSAKAFEIMQRESALSSSRQRKIKRVWKADTVVRSKASCKYGFCVDASMLMHLKTCARCQKYIADEKIKHTVSNSAANGQESLHPQERSLPVPLQVARAPTDSSDSIPVAYRSFYNSLSVHDKKWVLEKNLEWILPSMEQIKNNPEQVSRSWDNIFIDPPNPLIAARRRGAASPQDYCKTRVYFWIPEIFFPDHVQTMPCPNGLSRPDLVHKVSKKGWKRTVSLLYFYQSSTVYLYVLYILGPQFCHGVWAQVLAP